MSTLIRVLVVVVFAGSAVSSYAGSKKNGFDLSDSLIPAKKIKHGGPPRDGIPSIDQPKFISAGEASFLKDKDRIIGVYHNGIAKAYPIRILDWHEIVNDRFTDEAVLISYCPLCGSGMVFTVQGAGVHFTFGVSGLLYNNDVLLYDRQTGSLWSQILGKAISGPLKGVTLPLLPSANTTWRAWQTRYPETLVLSTDTGYRRNYRHSPYRGYSSSGELYFPVEHKSNEYRRKELVLGVTLNKQHKAYPFMELKKQGLPAFKDNVAGKRMTVEWSASEKSARLLDENGTEVPSVVAYWFAWYAFHPDTDVFHAEEREFRGQ
ncbi:MAG: DUF3179 domain-containing protein [Gammaproteobacteria bacterium]